MKQQVHRIAATTAFLCISTFFLSSLAVELFASEPAITMVKHLIVLPGLFIMVPAIAITGATGFALSKNKTAGLLGKKKKRMPFIAVNGLFILLPAAIVLDQWAAAGQFDNNFYLLQGLELIAGAINITLMSLNIRDGRKLTGKSKKKPSAV